MASSAPKEFSAVDEFTSAPSGTNVNARASKVDWTEWSPMVTSKAVTSASETYLPARDWGATRGLLVDHRPPKGPQSDASS